MRITTYAKDKYGRIYDLAIEHPSREQAESGNTLVNIVVNAWTGRKLPVAEVREVRS